jgi:hypothetical protein
MRSPSLMLVKCFRLKCFVKSPGLANDLVRFSNGKFRSPKHMKHMVGRVSVYTDNIAASSACFSASAAANCRSAEAELVRFIGARPRAGPPS